MPEIQSQTNLTINFENYHHNDSSIMIFLKNPIPPKDTISIPDNKLNQRTELTKATSQMTSDVKNKSS
jgi:hypothetical protein